MGIILENLVPFIIGVFLVGCLIASVSPKILEAVYLFDNRNKFYEKNKRTMYYIYDTSKVGFVMKTESRITKRPVTNCEFTLEEATEFLATRDDGSIGYFKLIPKEI